MKRFLAKILAGLAIHPALRGASSAHSEDSPNSLTRPDTFDESEVECGPMIPPKQVTGESYTGPRAGLQAQLEILASGKEFSANFKGRTVKFGPNACMGAAQSEFDEFVKERTKE